MASLEMMGARKAKRKRKGLGGVEQKLKQRRKGLGGVEQHQAEGDLGALGENVRKKSLSANYNPCTTLWTEKKQRIKDCLQPSTQRTKVVPKK